MYAVSETQTCSHFQLLCEIGVIKVSGRKVLLEILFIPSANCMLSIPALLLCLSYAAMHKQQATD